MNKKKLYHKSYLRSSSQYNNNKTDSSGKSVLPLLIFISLPFLFTVVLNFLLLNDNNNGLRIYLNKYSSFIDGAVSPFSDEILYQLIKKIEKGKL